MFIIKHIIPPLPSLYRAQTTKCRHHSLLSSRHQPLSCLTDLQTGADDGPSLALLYDLSSPLYWPFPLSRPVLPPGWSSASVPAWAVSVTVFPPLELPSTDQPLGPRLTIVLPQEQVLPPDTEPPRLAMTCWWQWQTLRVRFVCLLLSLKPIPELVSFI